MVELVIIMVGRLFGTLGLIGILKQMGYNAKIDIKELIFIWYAGMIRGAIAFGLVLRIDNIKVISFDNFSIAAKQPIEFDDQVRKHLEYCLHHLFKRQLVELTSASKDYPSTSIISTF